MNYIQSVWDLAEEICSDLKYVHIGSTEHISNISNTAEQIKSWLETREEESWPMPPVEGLDMLFIYELIANSVNYCFWYGKSSLRPNGSSSNKMYSLLDEAFLELKKEKQHRTLSRRQEVSFVIDKFGHSLIRERFPLIDQRIKHLKEIDEAEFLTCSVINSIDCKRRPAEQWLSVIIHNLPGYASDPFLKRAILFLIQINRRTGLFAEEIKKFPVPADYQLPKLLNHFDCINYADYVGESLKQKINLGVLIPEGSREEIEIRGTTISVCHLIAEQACCSCADVDEFLWMRRNECKDPFHLTRTTNY